MGEVVQRVSRTIGEKMKLSEGLTFHIEDVAEAAIESLYEPTDETIEAGRLAYIESGNVRDAYIAMMHAAFSREFPY